jgi:hypothetical protein
MSKSYRLTKDIVLKAGTVFKNINGRTTRFGNSNFSTLMGLTKDSCGEFIYGIDPNDTELHEWFEEINEREESQCDKQHKTL